LHAVPNGAAAEWADARQGETKMTNEMPALVLIDIQEGFKEPVWGRRNNPEAEAAMARMLSRWRDRGWPVFHVKHNSRHPEGAFHVSSKGNAIMTPVAPIAGEPLIEKEVNSAFIGTPLEGMLRCARVRVVVLVGLTTPHCVSTTARMAGNLGFEVFVASDGTASFELTGPDGRRVDPEAVHYHALAALNGEFANIATADEILARFGA
jgi:nicotinamidase-related amidase